MSGALMHGISGVEVFNSLESLETLTPMPVRFLGHGGPKNAIDDNVISMRSIVWV